MQLTVNYRNMNYYLTNDGLVANVLSQVNQLG